MLKQKSKPIAYLLWLFFGFCGAHNLYIRNTEKAIIKIICSAAILACVMLKLFTLFFIPVILLTILCFDDLFTLGKKIDKWNIALSQFDKIIKSRNINDDNSIKIS
jgi:TM2 domain-containing membrane protein YozV